LGREITKISQVLMGKAKPYYTPHLDCGDFVVVVNAAKIKVSGKKEAAKMYSNYSGYPGGLKKTSLRQLRSMHPDRIIRNAISGMLPDNKLKDRLLVRLYIFPGSDHPYKDKFKENTKN
jgi:large subunit ribosomal protein L13